MANLRTSGVFSLGSLSGAGASIGGDANWSDVTLLLDGSSTTDVTGLSTVTPSSSGYSTNNTTGAKFDHYIDFDGTNGFLNVTLPSALGASNEPFTVETWVKVDSVSNEGVFQLSTTAVANTGLSNGVQGNSSLALGLYGNKWRVYNETTNVDNLNSPDTGGNIDFTKWYHAALTSDGTTLRWFIDGTQIYSIAIASTSVAANGYSYLFIGGYFSYSYVMDGRIEGFRVTKGVARYTAAFNADPVITSPAAWPTSASVAGVTRRWGGITGRSIMTGGGGDAGDANWNEVEILIDGTSLTQEQSSDTLSITNSGTVLHSTEYEFNQGQALFGDAYDYVAVNDASLSPGTGDFTVEFWAKSTQTGNHGIWTMHNHSSVANSNTQTTYLLQHHNSDFILYNAGGAPSVALSTLGVTFGNWNHYAIVRSSGTFQLFVNGKLGTSNTDTSNITAPWHLFGHAYPGLGVGQYGFDGYMEQIRVTIGTARYYEPSGTVGTQTFTAPTEAFPASAVGDPLANTGVLSLAEHYQNKL